MNKLTDAPSDVKRAPQFTPGPWRQGRKNLLSIEPRAMPRVHRIAKVLVCPWGVTQELKEREAQANSRLIAAAPDLLKALQDLMDALREQEHPLAYGDLGGAANWAIGTAL